MEKIQVNCSEFFQNELEVKIVDRLETESRLKQKNCEVENELTYQRNKYIDNIIKYKELQEFNANVSKKLIRAAEYKFKMESCDEAIFKLNVMDCILYRMKSMC